MSFLTRIASLVRRPPLERDLDDEVQFHLEERQRRNIALGMAPEAAEADARRRFGSIERAKAGMRAARLARPAAVVLPLLAATVLFVAAGELYFASRDRMYDVTAGVTAPVPIATRRAEYTQAAMREKIQGTVRLQCVVRRDGVCSDVTVIGSLDQSFGLDDEAVRAIRDWRFQPGLHDGTPVATRIKFDLRFALR
jgi:TonB family protein